MFAMTYYAAICAGLGFLSPLLGGMIRRLILGAIIGAGAAVSLPLARETFAASLGL